MTLRLWHLDFQSHVAAAVREEITFARILFCVLSPGGPCHASTTSITDQNAMCTLRRSKAVSWDLHVSQISATKVLCLLAALAMRMLLLCHTHLLRDAFGCYDLSLAEYNRERALSVVFP